jgi:hypothetical protein
VVADPAARVARLQAGYPLGERALVEEPVDGLARPAHPAQVKVERRDQTRVEASVQTGADGLLVLGDPWYPQWRVEVDGRPAELLRVDHAVRGVRVPPAATRSSSPTRTGPPGRPDAQLPDRGRAGPAVVAAPAPGPGFRIVASAP